jgi:preprotein translocase subunit YajC
VLDAEGNKLEVGDMVNTAGGIDYRITKIVCGEVDQMPMIQLTKITYRSPDEIVKLK